MSSLEEDPILGRFFDTPEKKARWIARMKLLYLLWILFVVLGVTAVLIYFLL